MMPETQDKITEDGCNMFHVHFVFIFEAFSMTDGIPKEKKKIFNGAIPGIYFWLGTCLKIE